MKRLTTLALCLFFVQSIFAQAYDGNADYLKKNQAAVLIEYKFPQEIVEATLKDKLERQGLKIKNSKGYMIVYNSSISAINTAPYDYAFMVDRKSKKEKEVTVITLVINSTGEINTTNENSVKAKQFLNELAAPIEVTFVNKQFEEQEKVLAKAQKKYKNLQDDQSDLEKKKRNIEDDIAKNAREQTEQQAEVKRQQEILDAIRAKKK